MGKQKGAAAAAPLEDGYTSLPMGLFQLKTRTGNGGLVLIFMLVVATVFLVLGDDFSVVEQVGYRLPSWNELLNLQAVAEPNSKDLPPTAMDEQSSLSLFLPDHSPHHSYGADSETTESASPELQGEEEALPSEGEQAKESLPSQLPNEATKGRIVEWVEFPRVPENESELLIEALRENGTRECHNVRTKTGRIVGLPEVELLREEEGGGQKSSIELDAGPVHEIQIVSVGDDGAARCQGGDYYETDLSGPTWKSRPPIEDHQNGTYTLRLQMDPRFSGSYELRIILLFSNFHGFHKRPERWARVEEVANLRVEFRAPENPSASSSSLPLPLPRCERKDFVGRKFWSGRWTREKFSEDCDYTRYGRWICVNRTLQCQAPWCEGKVGSLDGNGWVYSAHCAFRIFSQEEAWKCLDKKWLFFWGDSNHIDTIRNLLNFVLGFDHSIAFLPRRMDETYYAPGSMNRTSVRITSMFNGHSNVTKNYEGLFSIHNQEFADQCRSFFTGETAPDFMIMNSGLHDGVFWRDMEKFVSEGVDFAVDFWTDVWGKMKAKRPDLLYRTTVATGGSARNQSFNPQKMEWMNHVILDRFARLNLERFQIIDGFDYTYPWHYDHKTNDGVHYGRPPAKSKWAGGNIGHRYFVDLMLVHILLNAIC